MEHMISIHFILIMYKCEKEQLKYYNLWCESIISAFQNVQQMNWENGLLDITRHFGRCILLPVFIQKQRYILIIIVYFILFLFILFFVSCHECSYIFGSTYTRKNQYIGLVIIS